MSKIDDLADVRLSEATISAIASLPEMEWRNAVLRVMLRMQSQVDSTTEITADTQEVLNRDVLQRLDHLADFLSPAESFFRVLGAIGNGAMRIGRWGMAALEFIGRLAKPLVYIAAALAATWAWWKTGTWTMPEWWGWFIR